MGGSGSGVLAPLSCSTASPTRACTSTYSVDSFVEYSSMAVARQPPAVRQQQDEELFRDLFAAENTDSATSLGLGQPMSKKSQRVLSGSGLIPHKPQSATRPTVPSTRQLPVVPQLNLSDLVIQRPHVEDPTVAVGLSGRRPSLLGQVVEEDEEELGGDGAGPETELQSSLFRPIVGPLSNNNNNKGTLEQETLRFLERLDLKTVLHTPRPEVDSYLPTRSITVEPSRTSTTDFRCEDAQYSTFEPSLQPAVGSLGPVKDPSRRPRPRSVRKGDPQVAASRLAHMEFTYGTTRTEPRRARRETLARLADPITGHSSTLRALSSDQRRRREGGEIDADSSEEITGQAAEPLWTSRPLLNQLSTAANVYHVAAATVMASPSKSPQRKSTRQSNGPSTLPASNNQIEDQLARIGGAKPPRGESLSARKEALRAKLRSRTDQPPPGHTKEQEAVPDWVAACSTFLTQREDEEEALAAAIKSSRPAVPTLAASAREAKAPTAPSTRRTPRSGVKYRRTNDASDKSPTTRVAAANRPKTTQTSGANRRGSCPLPRQPRDKLVPPRRGDPSPMKGVSSTGARTHRPGRRYESKMPQDREPRERNHYEARATKSAAESRVSTGQPKQATTPAASSILMGTTALRSASTTGTDLKKRPTRGAQPKTPVRPTTDPSVGGNNAAASRGTARGPRVRLASSKRSANTTTAPSNTQATARHSNGRSKPEPKPVSDSTWSSKGASNAKH